MKTKHSGNVARKVAFVTRAASGIGRAAAVAFARGREFAVRCNLTRAEDGSSKSE